MGFIGDVFLTRTLVTDIKCVVGNEAVETLTATTNTASSAR